MGSYMRDRNKDDGLSGINMKITYFKVNPTWKHTLNERKKKKSLCFIATTSQRKKR